MYNDVLNTKTESVSEQLLYSDNYDSSSSLVNYDSSFHCGLDENDEIHDFNNRHNSTLKKV